MATRGIQDRRQYHRRVQQDLGRELLGPREGRGGYQPDAQAGHGGRGLPERQDQLGPAERPDRARLGGEAAHHRDGPAPGKSAIAHQFGFLTAVDQEWVNEHLVPLFNSENKDDRLAVWEGFLYYEGISPRVAETLERSLLRALSDMDEGHCQTWTNFSHQNRSPGSCLSGASRHW